MADFHGEPGLVGGVEEGIRPQQAQGGVAPADQGLGAGDRSGAQVHDGLVLQLELVHRQCRPQLRHLVDPLLGGLVHGRGKHQEGVPAAFLGLVHGDVGIADEFLASQARFPQPDTGAGREGDRHTAGNDSVLQRFAEPGSGLQHGLRVLVRDEHREFIAAEARDQVARSGRGAKPQGRLAQHGVPGGVAEAVVDEPEGIKVHQDQGRLAVPCRPRQRLRPLFPAAASGWPGRSAHRC